ncbi:MAG: Sua5/YciO/YrdC/YwlC family protein [Eisenbergiella massiliensis]
MKHREKNPLRSCSHPLTASGNTVSCPRRASVFRRKAIVLLSWKEGGKAFSDAVGGESRYLGAFLPCTGLHQMLTEEAGPLIMTSCNVTEEPILTTEEEIQQLWEQQPSCLDGIAWNTRKIVTPLDDSLMRVTGGRPQMLRRSRGFVPSPILLPGECAGTVLAMGGDLKSAFCLASGTGPI